MSVARKAVLSTLSVIGAGGIGLGFALENAVKANDLLVHPPKQPWGHRGWLTALDHASLRRGYEVYKQVCSACHSVQFLCYRHMVGVTHSEEEMKAEAAEAMVMDGPNDQGEMFERPGKLSDKLANPYPNDEAARAANSGALPPDLNWICLGRHGEEDYIFSLLTGYRDPPAGITVGEGLHFNPYFPGGQIAMARVLYNELIEYSDGTPASASQMAKDVSTFLRWTAEPYHDERKRLAIKVIGLLAIMYPVVFYFRKHKWSILWSRQFVYVPRKGKPTK